MSLLKKDSKLWIRCLDPRQVSSVGKHMMGMKPRATDSRTLTSTLAISNLELSTQAAVFQTYFLEHWGCTRVPGVANY